MENKVFDSQEVGEHLLERLVQEIHNHPIGSFRYNSVKKEIEKILYDDEKNKEYLICIPSKFSLIKTEKIIYELHIANALVDFVSPDSKRINWNEFVDGSNKTQFNYFAVNDNFECLFKSNKTFLDDPMFHIVPRYEAEYDPLFKQIVVACLIVDSKKENILLLKSLNGRMKDQLSMVQGHVKFTRSCYLKNQYYILRENMIRELVEELNVTDSYLDQNISKNPIATYNGYTTLTEIEHFGVIYKLEVGNIDSLLDKNNEPDKHEFVKININDCLYRNIKFNSLDSWVKLILANIVEERVFEREELIRRGIHPYPFNI